MSVSDVSTSTPTSRPTWQTRLMTRKTLEQLLPWLVIIIFFALWEVICRVFDIDTFILPKPTDIAASLVRWRVGIWTTAFLISFFPIGVNVATGLATVEPELEDVLRSRGASKLEIFIKVGLPSSMPYFFASLKVAVTLAFVGSVIAETVASNRGIGYLMIAASSRFDVPLVFAGLTVIAAMGIVLYEMFAVIERRVTSWAYQDVT